MVHTFLALHLTAEDGLKIIIAAILAFISGYQLERLKNRSVILHQSVEFFLFGFSDPRGDWGNIIVTHNNRYVNNLFLYSIEIQNNGRKDQGGPFNVAISVPPNCRILGARGKHMEKHLSLELGLEEESTERWRQILTDWENLPPELQSNEHPLYSAMIVANTNRIFEAPVLNRKTKLKFDLLIEGNSNMTKKSVGVGIREKGVVLSWLDTDEQKAKRKKIIERIIGVIFFGSLFPIVSYAPSITWGVAITYIDVYLMYFLAKLIDLIWINVSIGKQ